MPSPGENALVPDSIPVTIDPEPSPDPEGVVLPEGTINVAISPITVERLSRAVYVTRWVRPTSISVRCLPSKCPFQVGQSRKQKMS